tara:strand:- start:607 stop:828 length:222 start_codon:yes stop_codon:yes gene_type:complete
MKNIIFSILIVGVSFAYYEMGEFVSVEDQNLSKSTCFPGNGYDVGDQWSMADWNGALNGGDYNVIFLEMSATW